MEDKNRELNVEELEQGVGGLTGREIIEKEKALMRMWKKGGKTKEEFIRDHPGQERLRMSADRYWDSL